MYHLDELPGFPDVVGAASYAPDGERSGLEFGAPESPI